MCIFCYGQTGSGKTHTMAGSDIESYEGRGINYRALDDLFALNEERRGEARNQLLSICLGRENNSVPSCPSQRADLSVSNADISSRDSLQVECAKASYHNRDGVCCRG